LLDVADVVLDLGTPPADALVELAGLDTPVAPGSTLAAVALVNELKTQIARRLVERGAMPPVITSAAAVGRDESARLFDAAYADHARRYARWLGGASLVAAAALALDGGGVGKRGLGLPYALLGAAFVVGDSASARRAETAAAVEAAHLAERTKIARELHDVLAHQLSAIAVRSGAARLAATTAGDGESTGPAQRTAAAGDWRSFEALAAVEQLSREALGELSHLLGALRREPDEDLRRPAPSLGSLDALLATAWDAGVPVDLELDGQVRPLSPGVELAAYRIIQEALTNVAKHAPAAPTRVVLEYRADRLGLTVVNGPSALGRPPDGASRGRGVRGMRERAALYSGRLEATPRPDGGFVVSA